MSNLKEGIKELAEDYKRKITSGNGLISNLYAEKNPSSATDSAINRLELKVGSYKRIYAELKHLLAEDEKETQKTKQIYYGTDTGNNN